MAIEFPCWSCGKTIKAAEKHAGKKCRCKSCEEVNSIPGQLQDIEEVEETEVPMQLSQEEASTPQDAPFDFTARSDGKVFCYKCGNSIFAEAEICPKCGVRQRHLSNRRTDFKGRDKVVAALLAFFLGLLGAHQFYLGNRVLGVVFLLFGLLGGVVMLPVYMFLPFLIYIPIVCEIVIAIFCIVQGIIYLAMSEEEFNNRYNPEA